MLLVVREESEVSRSLFRANLSPQMLYRRSLEVPSSLERLLRIVHDYAFTVASAKTSFEVHS